MKRSASLGVAFLAVLACAWSLQAACAVDRQRDQRPDRTTRQLGCNQCHGPDPRIGDATVGTHQSHCFSAARAIPTWIDYRAQCNLHPPAYAAIHRGFDAERRAAPRRHRRVSSTHARSRRYRSRDLMRASGRRAARWRWGGGGGGVAAAARRTTAASGGIRTRNSESGWGVNFSHQGNQIFATWYTYDTHRKAWWLSMLATQRAPTGTFTGNILASQGRGSTRQAGASRRTVGSGSITFTDASQRIVHLHAERLRHADQGADQVHVRRRCRRAPTARNRTSPAPATIRTCGGCRAESGWGMNVTQQGTPDLRDLVQLRRRRLAAVAVGARRHRASARLPAPVNRTSGPTWNNFNPAAVTTNAGRNRELHVPGRQPHEHDATFRCRHGKPDDRSPSSSRGSCSPRRPERSATSRDRTHAAAASPTRRAVGSDGDVVNALRGEERLAASFLQHRDRRAASGNDAQRRHHADRLPVRDGHARARIEDVAVAAPVEIEIALVIAAGRDRAAGELDVGDRPRARAADARSPTRHGAPSACAPIARTSPARFTSACATPGVLQDRRRAVGRVFLADAAEVDFHAGARQPHASVVPFDVAPSDQRARGGERRRHRAGAAAGRGNPSTRRSTPAVMSNSPPRELVAALRVVEERAVSASIGDGVAARRAVDPRGDAVVEIARIFRLDALHVGDRGVGGTARDAPGRARTPAPRCPRPSRESSRGGPASSWNPVRPGPSRGRQKLLVMPAMIQRAENGRIPGLPPPIRQFDCWR